MKKTIFRLCFLLTILSTLWCCRNEEFSTEDPSQQRSYNSSARFASKSFWKEDEVYIHKVQQVFMKVANMEHVKSRYGDLYWDYTMTFGQFGESYLLVPVVKDNRVVLLMEAVREGNKVYFFEKEDKGKIDFFQAVIFSKINDYGEKTDSQNSTSARNTPVFQCNTRWITIGCTDKEPNCTPYTTSETICKWIPGTTPKTFDPIGMDDGGGSGYEYPDPPEEKNPCEKTKSILTNPQVQAKINELKAQSKIGDEIGVKIKADGTTSGTIPGGGHDVELGSTAGYQGGYHNHTPTGIKMLSPPDIVKMLDFAMSQSGGNIQDGFLGMFGSEKCSSCQDGYRYYNYMINFSGNSQELAEFLYNTTWDLKTLKSKYQRKEAELAGNLAYVDYLGANLNNKGLEKLFFDTLKNMGMEGKVNLQKIEDNGTVQTIILNSNGNSTTPIPCP